MTVSNIKAEFECDIEKVWSVVTSLEEYSWRSDIDRIEILSDDKFVEYDKDGYSTVFTITACEIHKLWEFNMENDNIKGYWMGVFSYKNGKTTIDFTEKVTAKKLFMKPFVKAYLKKQQSAYINDLKKALV